MGVLGAQESQNVLAFKTEAAYSFMTFFWKLASIPLIFSLKQSRACPDDMTGDIEPGFQGQNDKDFLAVF